jgi:metal-responsive CopG/Arc/MetJ family transcriptional regulator
MTTITLNENLNQQISVIAQQTFASVDEVVNNVLAKYLNEYIDEALEDAELLAIVKVRENEPTIKVTLDDL